MNEKKIRVEYTSAGLPAEGWEKSLNSAVSACESYGFEFGVQIHNTASESQIKALAGTGLKMSFHAPLLWDYQINLAASDWALSEGAFAKAAELMRKYSVEKAVFHGFNMTDNPIPSFGRGRKYHDAFAAIRRSELCIEDSEICTDFFQTAEYETRRRRVAERMALIREKYNDLSFLIENDFPCYGSGSIFAEHICDMNNMICLDSSHLWASAFIFDRDYHQEVEKFLKTGLVGMVHLHASVCSSRIPKKKWTDGHLPLNTPNEMNLQLFIKLCSKYNVKHFVLEINGASPADIDYLASNLND